MRDDGDAQAGEGSQVEPDWAEVGPRGVAPGSMGPRPHHEDVGNAEVLLFGPAVSFQRPEQVLGIKPTPNIHDGTPDVLQVGADISSLPVSIVGGVREELVPFGGSPFQQECIGICQGAHPEEKIVAVRGFEIKIPMELA